MVGRRPGRRRSGRGSPTDQPIRMTPRSRMSASFGDSRSNLLHMDSLTRGPFSPAARPACREPGVVVPDDVVEPVMRLRPACEALHERINAGLAYRLDCRHAADAEYRLDAVGAPRRLRPGPVTASREHPSVEHGCVESMGTPDILAKAQARQPNLRNILRLTHGRRRSHRPTTQRGTLGLLPSTHRRGRRAATRACKLIATTAGHPDRARRCRGPTRSRSR